MFLGNGHSRRLPNNGGAHLAHCSLKRRIHAALTFPRRRPGLFTKSFVSWINELSSRMHMRMWRSRLEIRPRPGNTPLACAHGRWKVVKQGIQRHECERECVRRKIRVCRPSRDIGTLHSVAVGVSVRLAWVVDSLMATA